MEEKQKLLEMTDCCKRLERLFGLIEGEIEILQVEKKIRSRVKKQMERSQKEYYLNEQMQAIQKELGERGDHPSRHHPRRARPGWEHHPAVGFQDRPTA